MVTLSLVGACESDRVCSHQQLVATDLSQQDYPRWQLSKNIEIICQGHHVTLKIRLDEKCYNHQNVISQPFSITVRNENRFVVHTECEGKL
jgi:hypothetical protein